MALNYKHQLNGLNFVPQSTITPDELGDVRYNSTTNRLELYDGALDPILTENSTASTLTTEQIILKGSTSGQITITAPAVTTSYGARFPNADGTAGQVLSTDGAGHWAWINNGSGGSGVTSVGLALPVSVFTVSGSPVSSTGTLTGTLNVQTLNTVFAGPGSGPFSAQPTFRALVAADIPSLSLQYAARDLSNLTTPTAINQNLIFNTGATATFKTQDSAVADSAATQNLIISTGNKTAGSGNSGNITIQPGSSAGGTNGNLLLKPGTGGSNGFVQFQPNGFTAVPGSIITQGTGSSGDMIWNTMSTAIDNGIGGVQGEILYRGASGWNVLPAGASGQFLKTQGASANPVWGPIIWEEILQTNIRYYGSASSIADNAYTLVKFSTVDYDANSEYDPTTGLLSVITNGKFHFSATISFNTSSTTGVRSMAVIKNGLMDAAHTVFGPVLSSPAITGQGAFVEGTISLTAGDTLEFRAFQNSGGAVSLINIQSNTYMSIDRVG